MCLLPATGMVSDDTEHAEMTARALVESGGDAEAFARILAWKMRWWMAALPAGIGFATLRSIARLWLGFPPSRSGVRSAGNGACMRAPVVGAYFASDSVRRRAFVEASTRITHADERALRGAMVVAECTALAACASGDDIRPDDVLAVAAREMKGDAAGEAWCAALGTAHREGWDDARFLAAIGCPRGVTGYVHHTVPAVLRAWLAEPRDYRGCMARILAMGGDADTTAAIAGALCGTLVGEEGIPAPWTAGLRDFPRSVAWLRLVADAAASDTRIAGSSKFRLLFILPRNLFFIAVVLAHGLRRMLPPY